MIRNEEVRRQSDKILSLIEEAETRFEEDDEMKSHLAKYICVLCSGFIENAIHIIYSDYVQCETHSVAVNSFASNTLHKIQNPNSERIRDIAKSFNPDWESSIRDFLQVDDKGSAINYIMKDRHKIAHGKDSDITLVRIKEHHLKTIEVVKYIETLCIPTV